MDEVWIRKMRFPVESILIYFTKFCIERREHTYFDRRKLQNFLYKTKKEFPKILGELHFDGYNYSDDAEQELSNLVGSRMMESIGLDFHPHELSKGLLSLSGEIDPKYKTDLEKIAEKFYNEVGCNRRGEIEKHSRFNSIDDIF